MLFNAYGFMFGFLPVVWVVYALAMRVSWRLASPVLALASLFFYGWWDVRFLPLLVGSILFNFAIGRRLGAGARRSWLIFGIAANLSLLGFFKYAGFFLENAIALTGGSADPLSIILPIGISFFTFQQIAYLVDVWSGKSDHYRFADYTVFVAFFPQLIAGPIVHHREMMPQFAAQRSLSANHVALGLSIFIAGLFKKVVIADHLAQFVNPVFSAADAGLPVTMFEAWGATLAYSFQIYFDFSAYSDMAIGLARMFGIRLPMNFYSPYKATSIIEFWRRWHMTLSRFLRDYLYFPLGGNRKGPARRHANLMITMLLGGLWHGAGWGFVIWGGLHGLYLMINHAARAASRRLGWVGRVLLSAPIGAAATFLAVVFAWVCFRATTLDGAKVMWTAMLGRGGFSLPTDFISNLGDEPSRIGLTYAHYAHIDFQSWAWTGLPFLFVSAAICWLTPNTNQIFLADDSFYDGIEAPSKRLPAWIPNPPTAIIFATLFVSSLIYASTISEFLYFQF